MHTITRSQSVSSPAMGYLILFCFFVCALLFGAMVALFPPSFMSRVIIVLGAGIVLFVGLFLPLRDLGSNNRFLLLVLMATVFLAFLWPRYAFLKVSEHLPRLNPLVILEFIALSAIVLFTMKSRTLRAETAIALRDAKAIFAFLLLFLTWRFIANSVGEFPLASLSLFAREIVYEFAFFAIGLVLGRRPQGMYTLASILGFAAILLSALALFEYATQFNIFSRLAAQDESGALGAQLALVTAEKFRSGAYRAQASFDHPILLAQFAAAFLPVMWQLARSESGFPRRLLWISGIALLLAATYVARTRTGIMVLGLSIGLYLLLEIVSRISAESRSRGIAVAVVLIVCMTLIGVMVGPYVADIVIGRDAIEMASTNARLQMMAMAIPQVLESPIVGYGQGLATSLAGMGSGYLVTLDSFYLSLLLDNGIPGFALFSGLCVAIWLRSLTCAGRTQPNLLAGAFGISALTIFLSLSVVSIQNNVVLIYLFGGALSAYANPRES